MNNDNDSMRDSESYLYAITHTVHNEWVAAYRDGQHDRVDALSDLWAHVHHAHTRIKSLNDAHDQDKD